MSPVSRITPEERRRRRQIITERAEKEFHHRLRTMLNSETTEVCVSGEHDGCVMAACLCSCHDQSDPRYDHRCQNCGQDVQYTTGTMMAGSMWVHVGHSDHPARPVKKGYN